MATNTLISVWKVDGQGNQVSYKELGPYLGWTPVDVDGNNILWRNDDKRISFWVVDDQGNQVSYKEQGPIAGWEVVNYSNGRMLWLGNGKISIWKVDDQGNQLNFKEHQIDGWSPVNISGNYVLFHQNTGRISLWVLDDQGNQVSSKEYGPFPGYTVVNYADGRILWRNQNGGISLWKVDDQGNQLNFKEYAPIEGWTAVNCANSNVLWQHTDGRISLWVVDDSGNQVSFKEQGPFDGWRVVNYADDRLIWGKQYIAPPTPPPLSDPFTFDSGNLTVSGGLPLNGSAQLWLRKNGDFKFTVHAHDSGFDNIDYVVLAVLVSRNGAAFTFQHHGGVEGTSAGLPFGTPRRQDDWSSDTTNSQALANEWAALSGAVWRAQISGKDALVGSIEAALASLVQQALQTLAKNAATAVIALI